MKMRQRKNKWTRFSAAAGVRSPEPQQTTNESPNTAEFMPQLPNRVTALQSKLSILKLVFCPMSNQEAYWFAADQELEPVLRQSDFYMIGGRAEAKFLNLCVDAERDLVTLDFTIAERFSDQVTINLRDLPAVAAAGALDLQIEAGEKILRVWRVDSGVRTDDLLEWFTTEKLVFDKSRGRPGIEGFSKYREAYTYDLLYVGIAKVGDSYDRLIAKGHKARMEILANEPQRLPGSRVTDETFLFLFSVQPTYFKTFELDHDFQDDDFEVDIEAKRVVADAEKAFVSLLDPKYNTVKYRAYPRGSDGLYGSELTRYGYAIGESLTYNAPNGRFRGSWDPLRQFISNDGDCIFIEGDEVNLFLSGVHYAVTSHDEDANGNSGDQNDPKRPDTSGGA